MGEGWSDLEEHVATYLYERAVSCLPEGVLETLKHLTPEELDGLAKIGASLEAADADCKTYLFAVH